MPCLVIQLGFKQRMRLGNFLSFLSLVQVVAAWIICLSEVYFEYNIKWAVDIIGGFNSHFLQKTISASGLVSFFVYSLGSKIYFDSGHEETRSRFTTVFPLWSSILNILAFIKIVTISYSYLCMHSFQDSFRAGFLVAIKNYLTNTDVKEHVDYLQSEYKCCGASSFKDWMETSWIPDEYNLLTKMGDAGIYYKDYFKDKSSIDLHKPAIAPFSCCDINRLGPCIHDFLTQKILAETVQEEWWLGLTLWQKGCGEIFESIYKSFLQFIYRFMLANFCVDVFMMILFRYLRTSVEMLELSPNKAGLSPGWLCNCLSPKPIGDNSASTKKTKQKRRFKV